MKSKLWYGVTLQPSYAPAWFRTLLSLGKSVLPPMTLNPLCKLKLLFVEPLEARL